MIFVFPNFKKNYFFFVFFVVFLAAFFLAVAIRMVGNSWNLFCETKKIKLFNHYFRHKTCFPFIVY